MGFNLTQELKKKKWDYFPLPSWKGYGFKTNERRRQWCSTGWATYQRTLFLTVFINFYILTISLWICFPISVDSFLYRSSILITHNKVSISFHHVYIQSIQFEHTPTWRVYLCISTLYTCVIALLQILYTFPQPNKLTVWDGINRHWSSTFLPALQSISLCTLCRNAYPTLETTKILSQGEELIHIKALLILWSTCTRVSDQSRSAYLIIPYYSAWCYEVPARPGICSSSCR